MSERLGFALVLLVAIASVASLLFLTKSTPTGYVTTIHPPTETTCKHVVCPRHEPAYPLLNGRGMVVYHDDGNPVCICPPR